MELNAEINKVFGTEMAKLFADKISDEKLSVAAEKAWDELNKKEWDYGKLKDSVIEKKIKETIIDRIYQKVKEILNEPIAEEILEKKAREMVEAARKAGEEAIIRDMAKNMANNALSIYGRDEEIVRTVLNQLHLESENRRY